MKRSASTTTRKLFTLSEEEVADILKMHFIEAGDIEPQDEVTVTFDIGQTLREVRVLAIQKSQP